MLVKVIGALQGKYAIGKEPYRVENKFFLNKKEGGQEVKIRFDGNNFFKKWLVAFSRF